MIPHICRVAHNPPASYGDCLRCAVASMLNVDDVELVPHFMASGDDIIGDLLLRSWLLERGKRPFIVALPGNLTLQQIFAMMADGNPDIEYMLFCTCGADRTDHVVICKNDEVIHDPAVFPASITGPASNGLWVVMVLV